jgi:molybdopterin synthase catalytic subunit
MLRDGLKHGFAQSDWDAAKEEARAVMIDRAKLRGMIPYSELVRHMKSIKIEAHDPRLFHMLGEISSEEDAAGRGMLTVLVVHKVGDMQPGPGFFELAKRLGRNTSNILKCWVDELHKVHAIWSGK